MTEADLLRALRVISWSNADRVIIFGIANLPRAKAGNVKLNDTAEWFLEHIDELAPELHQRGWIAHVAFTRAPGEIVVPDGKGDVQAVAITELGRLQLNAAVAP